MAARYNVASHLNVSSVFFERRRRKSVIPCDSRSRNKIERETESIEAT